MARQVVKRQSRLPRFLLALAAACPGVAPGAWAEQGGEMPTGHLEGAAPEFRAWLPRALEGDARAAFELGAAFAHGAGRAEDYAEAARWYRKAAERGNPRAQHDLAVLYGKGLGVPQDYVRAYVWFDLAAAGFGHGRRRERAIELRDMMAAFMTPAERAEAERLAQAWQGATK